MSDPRPRPISYEEPTWNDPHVRDDLMLQCNFRMPEKVMLKIDWIARMEGVSKRQVVEDALRQFATKMLKKHGVQD